MERGRTSADLARNLEIMGKCLSHRGPDHQAQWVAENRLVGLVHRRLSIIDLSVDGNQPMRSPSGRFVVTFNGEIYNYIELRAELEARGRSFRTQSDTEVLLASFEDWGVEGALNRVLGMFALALWDRRDHRLTLTRDRPGKKPLYYAKVDGSLYFASEMKALLKVMDGGVIDRESLHHYLSLGYIPAPRTIYENIREIPAGSLMNVDEALQTSIHRYWTLPAPSSTNISFEDAVEETETRLRDAVRIRLRADVPVGLFLSGGIDSGLLAALASEESSEPIRTFTISFGESRFDESAHAALVAERYGTDHTVIPLNPDLETLVPRVVRAYDEPFADPSALPTFAVAEAAAQEVRVVLNGEGADELFAGYRRSQAAWRMQKMSAKLSWIPDGLTSQLHRLLPRPKGFRTPYALGYRFLGGLGLGLGERYITWSSDGFTEEEKASLYFHPEQINATGHLLDEEWNWLEAEGDLDRFMALDLVVGMGDCLLVKMDIATMASSLEARCPFLDHRMMEWAASLPREVVFKGGDTKPILRSVAKNLLPLEIVSAPKRGFEIPLADWVGGPLDEMIRESLQSSRLIIDLFRPNVLKNFLEKSESGVGRERRAKLLWILFMLSQWDIETNNS